VIPLTVDDRVADDLLGQGDRQICWDRSVETLMARKDEIAGLAVASDERIEANLLHVKDGMGETEIVSLRSFVEVRGARMRPSGSRRSTRPRSRRSDWRCSVSAPPAGIYCTQHGRGRSKDRRPPGINP
jgi:hypothetical protein